MADGDDLLDANGDQYLSPDGDDAQEDNANCDDCCTATPSCPHCDPDVEFETVKLVVSGVQTCSVSFQFGAIKLFGSINGEYEFSGIASCGWKGICRRKFPGYILTEGHYHRFTVDAVFQIVKTAWPTAADKFWQVYIYADIGFPAPGCFFGTFAIDDCTTEVVINNDFTACGARDPSCSALACPFMYGGSVTITPGGTSSSTDCDDPGDDKVCYAIYRSTFDCKHAAAWTAPELFDSGCGNVNAKDWYFVSKDPPDSATPDTVTYEIIVVGGSCSTASDCGAPTAPDRPGFSPSECGAIVPDCDCHGSTVDDSVVVSGATYCGNVCFDDPPTDIESFHVGSPDVCEYNGTGQTASTCQIGVRVYRDDLPGDVFCGYSIDYSTADATAKYHLGDEGIYGLYTKISSNDFNCHPGYATPNTLTVNP